MIIPKAVTVRSCEEIKATSSPNFTLFGMLYLHPDTSVQPEQTRETKRLSLPDCYEIMPSLKL